MRLISVVTLSLLISGQCSALAAPLGEIMPLMEAPRDGGRLKIGLVLSGGGARGAAHVGVLKILEQHHIPIDAIAGTSMGAVVGGLYASGMTANEIERVLNSAEWRAAFKEPGPRDSLSFRRKTEDQKFLVDLPLGLNSGNFRLPKGIFSGQRIAQLLRQLTLPVAQVLDFDALPTRFRAVATDLETGEAVVLGSGDLTTVMRASFSAPGVFAPVQIENRVLVDGGLTNNLPVDVARAMGVDLLIVVDVGFPLRTRTSLDSVTSISSQMLAILVRRGSDEQRHSLSEHDILLSPALGEASSFDFKVIGRAIPLGERAALDSLVRLINLSIRPDDYIKYLAQRTELRAGAGSSNRPVNELIIAQDSKRYERLLRLEFNNVLGKSPNAQELDQHLTNLYGSGNFESVDYKFIEVSSGYDLQLSARRNSWGPNYLRFGLNLEDDFNGQSQYNVAARFVLADINSLGAEWVWDLQIGSKPKIYSEIYFPFSELNKFFLLPQASFEMRNVPLLLGQRTIAEYRLSATEYGLDLGREFSNWGELRGGLHRAVGHTRLRLGDPVLQGAEFDVREYFARFSYDHLDNRNFPRHGQSLVMEWRGQRRALGSNEDTNVANFDWLLARSWGRDTAIFWSSFGTNFGSQYDSDSDASNVRALFSLGGFMSLSGLARDSISGQQYAIARALYYRQIGRGGEGFLELPTYAGASFEIGNVWDQRRNISFNSVRKQGSVFFGFDTLLGPVYLGSGFGEGGDAAFYLFLGRTF